MSTAKRSVATPQIGYLVADVLRLMRRDFRARAKGLGLTPALARLLFYVHREPGSHQTTLAAVLDVTPVTLGRMLDKLVERGYVARRPDPEDRRAIRVYIAPRGEPLVERMSKIAALTADRATRGITAADRKRLLAGLATMRANLATEA